MNIYVFKLFRVKIKLEGTKPQFENKPSEKKRRKLGPLPIDLWDTV